MAAKKDTVDTYVVQLKLTPANASAEEISGFPDWLLKQGYAFYRTPKGVLHILCGDSDDVWGYYPFEGKWHVCIPFGRKNRKVYDKNVERSGFGDDASEVNTFWGE